MTITSVKPSKMTMRKVFVDTSGWAHYFIQTEPFYYQTNMLVRGFRANGILLVTTNYILAELTALLESPFRVSKAQQVQHLKAIKQASWVEKIHIDWRYDQEAWGLFESRLDKVWSLVDCSSFVVMSHWNITHALTSDHHFEQAGFVQLLGK